MEVLWYTEVDNEPARRGLCRQVVCICEWFYCTQSDLTCPHTSALSETADEVRELDINEGAVV